MSDSRYRLSIAAEVELDEILEYIRKRNRRGAENVYRKMRSTFERLGDFPLSGSIRPWLTDRAVRFASVFKYQIVYVPEPASVHILHIYHGARDIRQLLDEAHDLP